MMKKTHQILRTTEPASPNKTRAVRISTYSSIGERDGHDGGCLHDPGQRVPHEAQELEDLALLQTRTHARTQIHHGNFTSRYLPTKQQEQERHEPKAADSLTCFSSSLLGPKMVRRCSACAVVRPCGLHRRFSNTSSIGMFSCAVTGTPAHQNHGAKIGAVTRTKSSIFGGERTRWGGKKQSMLGSDVGNGADWADKRRANVRIEKLVLVPKKKVEHK